MPLVIVQHMPPIFTALLAERLTAKGPIPVREAAQGETLTPGTAWIAPGNHHVALSTRGESVTIEIHQEPLENSCRPSVDVLFRSIADIYGPSALAVILTGMGSDGLRGCRSIREAGGRILAQDEASSVVWGMPGAVVRAGLADEVLPLDDIGPKIVRRVRRGRHERQQ